MSIFDIVFFVSLLTASISGLRSGIVKQILGLGGIIVGIWLAYRLSKQFSEMWIGRFDTDTVSTNIVIFIIILILFFFLVSSFAGILTKMINLSGLGWLNRFFGFFFAILQTIVIFGALAYALDCYKLSEISELKKDLDKSITYKPLVTGAQIVFPYMKFESREILKTAPVLPVVEVLNERISGESVGSAS